MKVIEGVVVEGRRIGRELGFPTANIEVGEQFDLPNGVYRARVELPERGKSYEAVANLGHNPSVGGCERRLESHLLDYDGASLYGKSLRVTLCERLRDEQHFESLEELRRQIADDIRRVRQRMEL